MRQPSVTVEEIKVLLQQGAEEGVFEATEHEIVTNVLNLDERHVGSVLTPRSDVVYLDVRDPVETTRDKLRGDAHSVFRCATAASITFSASCDRQRYTLGGLAMLALGRVPKTGDVFVRGDYRFEIVEMDGNRVARVLVSQAPPVS